jgi:Uma2 family endonuclease
LPPGPLPDGYLDVVPELVFEVKSPSDRWAKITTKVGEYLDAGILVVCVLDPQTATLTVYRADEFPRTLERAEEFTLPELLGDFRARVREFVE